MSKIITSSKPLFILPCSAEKLATPAQAVNLYQGKGYLPLLGKSTATVGIDYHLAILSAKYGLIHALDVIEPYDKKLIKSDIPTFVKQHRRRANGLVKRFNPSGIVACLPKCYLSALTAMLSAENNKIPLLAPPEGGGIGVQRGFLASQLKRVERKHCDVYMRGYRVKRHPSSTALIRIREGDMFTPWLGNKNGQRILGEPVQALAFTRKGHGDFIIDRTGKSWSTTAFSFGLPPAFADFTRQFITDNVDGIEAPYPVLVYSTLLQKYASLYAA